MIEGLSPPIDGKETGESQRVIVFANYIQAIYEGQGMRLQMPVDELQQELEKGHGAPGEYSYVMT